MDRDARITSRFEMSSNHSTCLIQTSSARLSQIAMHFLSRCVAVRSHCWTGLNLHPHRCCQDERMLHSSSPSITVVNLVRLSIADYGSCIVGSGFEQALSGVGVLRTSIACSCNMLRSDHSKADVSQVSTDHHTIWHCISTDMTLSFNQHDPSPNSTDLRLQVGIHH